MARPKKLSVSALNVRIINKEARDYAALFRAILRAKQSIAVRGTDHLILTAFGPALGSQNIPFSGVLGKYTDIPEDADWLDTASLVAANEDRLEEIKIPSDLKPNFQSFFCVLFPDQHIFAFETYSESRSLSARAVEKWLRVVVKIPAIRRQFGEIEVDVIPDYQVVERILKSDFIRRIDIHIRRTNPDDYDADAFAKAEERLQRLNAVEEDISYIAASRQFLQLDDETKALARVGAENGTVNARIKENGTVQFVSTSEYPIEVQDTYEHDTISMEVAFRSLALKLLGFVQRNRRDEAEE
jgi:hypothetical protein